MNTQHPHHGNFAPRRWLLGIFACLMLLLLMLGGYWFLDTRQKENRRHHYEQLETIARLKTNQLLAWRQERLSDVRLDSSGYIRTQLLEWRKTGAPSSLENMASRMRLFQALQGYHNIILAGTDGRILVSLIDRNTDTLEPEVETLMHEALSAAQPMLGDFYHCHTCEVIHLNVAMSVVDENDQAVAVLILVVDPAKDIFPLMQTWPVPHANAESFLIRKEGDRVLFLSPLRYQSAPPFSFYGLPLSAIDSPAVRAVLGETGMVTGPDYRGVPVLADIRAVPGTQWYAVTKLDLKPLLTEARVLGGGVLFMVVMVVGMTAALVRLDTISRQKDLSEALLEAQYARMRTQEEIRATLYGIGAGVIATNGDGLVTRMNPEAERMCGWTEQEALGQPLVTVFHVIDEEFQERVALPVQQVLQAWEVVGVSHRLLLVGRDGQCLPVTDSWSPIYNDSGEITGVVLVFRDQTRKKAMEQAQVEIGKRYSDLVESVNDLIWETDPNHRFTFVSRRVSNLLGFCPEEIIGKSWDAFLGSDEGKPDALLSQLAQHRPFDMVSHTWMRKDGGKVIVESSGSAIFDQQEVFLGYRGISRDITGRRQAEAEQEKLQAQLRQAQKMDTIGRLAGGVAHDFNNMLTVICNYAEMSLEEIEQEHPLRKRLAAIHQAALHSAGLTRQLLAFARKQVIAPRILDLNDTIEGSLKMLRRLIGENIELSWKPGEKIWSVTMDPTQVGQILANLAVNARDAITGTGHLIITTENKTVDQADLPGDYVQITVSDDGCGMMSDVLACIFEPFFTTKEEDRGTGLGLATVHGIVYQNGGFIRVYSEPEKGTTFRIYLPRAEVAAEVAAPARSVPAARCTETVLIVEDEITILELSSTILAAKGYQVLAANSPNEALERVRAHDGPIHLVITDVIMPQMNGRDLLERITRIKPGIRSLYMSGYTADIIAKQGILEAGLQFIEKPFSVKDFCSKVRAVLDQG
jgi:PAS domain S-box-containing protein